MGSFDRIVADPRLRGEEVEAHLAGPDAGRPLLGRYRVFTTAGTTGVRGLFVEDAGEFAEWIGTCLRGLACWGWGRRHGWPGSAPPARCTSPTRCMPCRWPGRPAPLPGGRHHPAARDGRDPQRLPARGADRVVAAGRQGRAGMDVLEDLVAVEVVDQRGRPVAPGVPGHKVLLTSLVNRVQPLLRYELTDSVTVAGGRTRWGCRMPASPPSTAAATTSSPCRRPAAGGVAVHPFRLRAPFSELLEVRQYQVAHGPDGLRVAVVPRESAPADTTTRVRAALARGAPPRRRGPTPDRGRPGPPDRPRPRPRRQAQARHQRSRRGLGRGGVRWVRARDRRSLGRGCGWPFALDPRLGYPPVRGPHQPEVGAQARPGRVGVEARPEGRAEARPDA